MFHTLHCLVCLSPSLPTLQVLRERERKRERERETERKGKRLTETQQNNIRKALRPAYYGPPGTDPNHQLHQDHCIEQLRQSVMCAGDMTPVPTRYYASLGRNYVDSDVRHTCRNFGTLQEWVVGRYEGSTAVRPQHHHQRPRR